MPYSTNSWDMWIDIILILFFNYLGVYPTTTYHKVLRKKRFGAFFVCNYIHIISYLCIFLRSIILINIL